MIRSGYPPLEPNANNAHAANAEQIGGICYKKSRTSTNTPSATR
jgi:hypothetical protein